MSLDSFSCVTVRIVDDAKLPAVVGNFKRCWIRADGDADPFAGALKRNCVLLVIRAWYPIVVLILFCLRVDADTITAFGVVIMNRLVCIVEDTNNFDSHLVRDSGC